MAMLAEKIEEKSLLETHQPKHQNMEEQFFLARPRLASLTRRYGVSPDVVDDVVQETFLHAWRHLVLEVVFVRDALHSGAQVFSLILTASALGGLIGGVFVGKVGKILPPHHLFALSLISTGVLSLMYINIAWLPMNVVLIALVGVAVVGWIVSLTTMAQLVDNAYRGRVMSTYGTTQTLLMLGGMGVSAVLAAPLGVVHTLDIAGGLFILSGIAATIALRTPRKKHPF